MLSSTLRLQRAMAAPVRRMSIMPSTHTSYANSLEWVKAGCPATPEVATSSNTVAKAATLEVPEWVLAAKRFLIEGNGLFVLLVAAAVHRLGKAVMFDPLKDADGSSRFMIVEGQVTLKPEEDEEDAEEGPTEFENTETGTRYGGAFVAKVKESSEE